MFQEYTVRSSPEFGQERLTALRGHFADLKIDAFLIPKADEYQGEYIPECAERLAWLTGFTGSAGIALVTSDEAIVFVDGRYKAQVVQQIDADAFSAGDLIAFPPSMWIGEHGRTKMRLGVDPWLHTSAAIKQLEAALAKIDGELVFLERNPVDMIWTDQPSPPLGSIAIQPLSQAGVTAVDKLADVKTKLTDHSADAVVISDPSSIAWLFNIRGSDVPHTPLPLSRAIIPAQGLPSLFIDKRKASIEEEAYLNQLADLFPPSEFEDALKGLGEAQKTVMVDPAIASHAIAMIIGDAGGTVLDAEDPARLPRAIKNAAEIDGMVHIHRQDGVAMVRFLAWLDSKAPENLDEITVSKKLESFRQVTGQTMQMPLKDISFDTISGVGSNGAIIHYRVTEQTNRKLKSGELYLVDSGGQYVSGTTDITRTIALGEVGDEPKHFFTLVLKGMIAVSRLRFPAGTRGVEIDPFARAALWSAGVDYGHGTGHGVGAYLAVHEGPQNISRRGTVALEPGMIVSNEPGYYREGAFGIRIENLVLVHEPVEIAGGEQPMLGFDTLTLCPIDRRLIKPELLSVEELAWLNGYHARVLDELTPLIDKPDALNWLIASCAPITS